MTVTRVISGVLVALLALPVLLLVGFALGPLALVPVLIAACVVPPLLLAGAIWFWASRQ
jgi:hypothetical protein